MNARDTLEKAVKVARGDVPNSWACLSERDRDTAELGVRRVIAAGFVIMSKEDVEAVRDKALEEAAVLTEAGREVPDPSDNYRSTTIEDWEDMIELAAAIRSLKSGGRDEG